MAKIHDTDFYHIMRVGRPQRDLPSGINISLSEQIIYVCNHCKRHMTSRSEMISHLKETHKQDYPVECDSVLVRPEVCHICGFDTSNNTYPQSHSVSRRRGWTPGLCLCQKCRSVEPEQLYQHRTPNNKTYNCSYCGKPYSHKQSLQQHVIREHDDSQAKHHCRFCKKGFYLKYHMEVHERTHQQKIKCPKCQKICTNELYLQGHLKTHHN